MAINETGMDEEEVDRQIARDNERADQYGHVFDSDPRKTTPKGNLLGGDAKDTQDELPADEPRQRRGKETNQ
jgi:capsid protein